MARRANRRLRGSRRRDPSPDWRPLLDLAPDEVPEFMWMFRVDLADGTVIEAYKHAWTRRYLHLDASGRAYVLVGDATYEQADPTALLAEVGEGGGKILTEDDIEKIADEIESDEPVVFTGVRFVGRPSLDGSGTSPRLNFRVPRALYDAAAKRAAEEERTVSAVAREALEKFLAG